MTSLYGDVYPASWYALAPSPSLRPREVRAVDAFGSRWVLFRTASGEARLYDRFCPHMGASLACGRVERERIVCPFHNWTFAAEGAGGRCVRIPYLGADRIPERARLPGLPLIERFGWIWVWNGAEPAFALPDLPEAHDRAYGVRHLSRRFDVHALLILENGCDAQHFKYVHGLDFVRYDVEMLKEERHELAFRIHQEIRTKTGTRSVVISIHYVGAGAIFGTLERRGRKVARFIAAPLPVSATQTLFHLIVFPKRLPRWLRGLDPVYARWFARQLFKGSTDDYEPIWRHMNVERRGVLVADDALQQRFRRYYSAHLPPSSAGC